MSVVEGDERIPARLLVSKMPSFKVKNQFQSAV
jgi:hypothetical protein